MAPGESTGYRLTPKAEDDLAAIWRYSAETWSAAQADTCLDTLVATIETIVAMPILARERREFDPPVRIHPTAEHVIIYLIDGDVIFVIRILGGRQNWRAMLDLIDA
jgi:toxin ParE1/3/4